MTHSHHNSDAHHNWDATLTSAFSASLIDIFVLWPALTSRRAAEAATRLEQTAKTEHSAQRQH